MSCKSHALDYWSHCHGFEWKRFTISDLGTNYMIKGFSNFFYFVVLQACFSCFFVCVLVSIKWDTYIYEAECLQTARNLNIFLFIILLWFVLSEMEINMHLAIIVRYALSSRRYQILNRLSESRYRQQKILWFSDTILKPCSSPIINSR